MAGNWHAARGTPVGGIVCLGASACLLACSGSFLQLLDYTSTGLTAVSALVVAAIFPLRRRMPSAAGFRMPLYPLPPLLVLGLSTWTVAAVLMQPEKRLPALLSLGTIAAGIPLAGWLIRNKK
jgi:L-asparagine transporter-like permease